MLERCKNGKKRRKNQNEWIFWLKNFAVPEKVHIFAHVKTK